jgi:acyl-CoA synthetase (AMP-forming)/AMP-acid ligase II
VQTIPEAISWWAEKTPEAPALLGPECPAVSYRELHCRVTRSVAALRRLDVAQHDRVAIVLPDGVAGTIALLGAMSGSTAAPLNPLLSPPEIQRDLGRLHAKVVIVAARSGAAVQAAGLGLPVFERDSLSGHETTSFAAGNSAADDIAAIIHTSGTTSLPKRVPITHRMLFAGARGRNSRRGFGPADSCLLLAPGFTVMYLTNLVTMLAAGGSAILVPRLEPLPGLRAHAELQPTWILAAPSLYHAMLEYEHVPRSCEWFRNSRLRLVNWGGSGADPALVRRLERAFSVPCDSVYGMSEASAIASPAAPGSARPGSVGKAAAAEIRIVNETGALLPAGATGEIAVRGPTVFAGYLDDAVATAAAFFPDGWFRTGDLGYLDGDDFLFLTGRLKDLINRGGVKIAPVEVDQALLSHPAVAEAATFAVPDAVLGEDAVAAVVVRPGMRVTPRELRRWMLARLTPAKVPRRVWFVLELPRTETGKVQRGELRRRFDEGRA